MNSIRLRYFIAVTETESIRKAAEVLHLSPAALSKAIKQLEYEAGTTLLVPAGRGIVITEKGQELAQRARPLIEELDRLKLEFKGKKKSGTLETKPIRIGTFEIFSTHFLAYLVNSFPDISELTLREAIPGQIEKKLLAYEIDYGITNIPTPLTGVLHQPIASFELQVFGRADIFATVPFAQLPFAAPVEPIIGTLNAIKGLDGWPDNVIARSIKYQVDLLESALELCRKGKAVAYLPSFLIRLHNKTVKPEYSLQSIPLPDGMTLQKQTIYLAKRKNEPDHPMSRNIIKALRKICHDD